MSTPPLLPSRRLLWREVPHLGDLFSRVTPNWFASIMGTGIVANAAMTLPVHLPALLAVTRVIWILAAVLLCALTVFSLIHLIRYRATVHGYLSNPAMLPFFGAVPMAFLTVGTGTLLYGPELLGADLAVGIDLTLWIIGSALGALTAIAVPWLFVTRVRPAAHTAFGGWLMPIVPPMVSATSGGLLLEHIPAGDLRLLVLLGCYAAFGFTLIMTAIILVLIVSRVLQVGAGDPVIVPTLWIVLGPIGQSVTAAFALGNHAHLVVDATLASALESFAVIYAVPALGFGLGWALFALLATARAARAGLPFALTWWSFIFPVGTCVTGLSALAIALGSGMLGVIAVVAYAALACAWIVVASRTAHGSIVTGRLLVP